MGCLRVELDKYVTGYYVFFACDSFDEQCFSQFKLSIALLLSSFASMHFNRFDAGFAFDLAAPLELALTSLLESSFHGVVSSATAKQVATV